MQQTLWEHLQGFFQQDTAPIVREAIDVIGSLPDLKKWRPAFKDRLEALNVIEWGIPLIQTKAFFDEASYLKPLAHKIGGTIARKGTPEERDLAELDAAALMALHGVQRLKRVKEKDTPTPDFHVQWDEQLIELEVTKALLRETHSECHDFADHLLKQILGFELPWRIIVYVAYKLNGDDTYILLDTLRAMTPGEFKYDPGKWWLFVKPAPPSLKESEFNVTLDLTQSGALHLAEWPPEFVHGGGHIGVSIYNPEEGMISLRFVGIMPGVPILNYINPLERKVTRVQGTKTNPFVVAVDIGHLPGSYAEYQKILPFYLKEYPHISAVLLFQRECRSNKFGWIWGLHVNPDAVHPLPFSMQRHFPTEGSLYWSYQ